MAKNILIFSDGTGQSGGQTPDQRLSNVYKLYRATRVASDNVIDPDLQIAFYDAGLGTDADAADNVRTRLARSIRKFASSATGAGLGHNIVDCYEAILRHYEPGDRIYLFGFSRGAYTARCVAGVLGLCGVPTSLPGGAPLPNGGSALRAIAKEAVHKVYEHGSGRARSEFRKERAELARRFREKYSSGEKQANAVPYFVGVFDTVAALGTSGLRRVVMNAVLLASVAMVLAALSGVLSALPKIEFWPTFLALGVLGAFCGFFALARARLKKIADFPTPGKHRYHWSGWKFGFYDTYLNPRIRFARHALAIDETRSDFDRVLWGQSRQETASPKVAGEPEPFIQLWFAGNHSDIGGSYPEVESRLSDIALQWMIDQATALPHPVHIDHTRLKLFARANGIQHCEVEALLDAYPSWVPSWARRGWGVRVRSIPPGAPVHESVVERLAMSSVSQCGRSAPYRPESLRGDERFISYYVGSPSKVS